jgi:hypothetical protein
VPKARVPRDGGKAPLALLAMSETSP